MQHLDTQLKAVTGRLQRRITTSIAPDLVAVQGVGPDVASTLLLTASDNPHRLERQASFAAVRHLAATRPAAARRRTGTRLKRGGDRQANAAPWRMAIVRLSRDPRTREYMNKRQREGRSTTAALRCLKRYIAREVVTALP